MDDREDNQSWLSRNLVSVIAFVGGAILGPAVAFAFLPADFGVGLRLAWGLVGGLGCGFIVVANRLIGAYGAGEW